MLAPVDSSTMLANRSGMQGAIVVICGEDAYCGKIYEYVGGLRVEKVS
jgi:hypothetical protein